MIHNLVLFDGANYDALKPFTFTRPCAAIRVGILTIAEKWEHLLGKKPSFKTQDYLSTKFPCHLQNRNLFINGTLLPDNNLVEKIINLKENESLIKGEQLLAFVAPSFPEDLPSFLTQTKSTEYPHEINQLNHTWDIFQKNGEQLKFDFELLTKNRDSQPLHNSNTLIGDTSQLFIEEGAEIYGSVLNVQNAPIYIGKNAKILENCAIRNGLALGENAVVKMGAKIYGATTIGPYGKVGGEINNSVIFGYSNKGHDGFLGNSVLGEWCNLGADTNNSNLKNNYAEIKMWDYATNRYADSGLQFCGLMMGDHSKCGINTMFNTGTVVGVSANIYGAGFPKKFIPSFCWGGVDKSYVYKFDKAMDTAKRVMVRRNIDLDEVELNILETVFEQTEKNRVVRKM